MLLTVPADPHDADPWPRAAAVGPGSAFAAVPAAVTVPARAVRVVPGADGPAGAGRRAILDWTFGPLDAGDAAAAELEAVTVPHTWSRRRADLADFRGPVQYRTSLRADAERARLVFDAVDYLATAEVDGAVLARHEGGFTPVAVELPTGRECAVRVVVDDPVEEALLGVADPLLLAKAKIKGVHEWHDSRPGGMAITPFDPRWVTRWGSGGISGSVWLHESGPVRIEALFVTATPESGGAPGELRLSWVLDSATAGTVELSAEISGSQQRVSVAAELPVGPSRVSVRLEARGVQPWSAETPVLYTVTSRVQAAGRTSDTTTVVTGFRRVRMPLTGALPMALELNGARQYVRAANYIPGAWPGEIDAELLERDTRLARAAGLNSLGVHAGAWPQLLPATDRHGVLVYQDFPMQWSYDPARPALFDGGADLATTSLHLAAELSYLLYNHPSLVYWCAHNEPAYQLAEAFETANTPELMALYDTLLAMPDEAALDCRRAALFGHLDPGRPALPASGLGASRPVGDVHDYTGSLSGGSALNAGTDRHGFVSEFGAWSANFSAGMFGHDWHANTHLVATQEAYAGQEARYDDFQTWCFAGQLWAAWHAKVITEKARRHRFAPSVAVRYHFFLDHFGHGGAGMVDRWRCTGPGYRGLAAANRPLLAVAPVPAGGRVRPGATVRVPITVVNDRHDRRRPGQLRWWLARLGADDVFLVGRDTPMTKGPLQAEIAPLDQVAVLPRRTGEALLDGTVEFTIEPDSAHEIAVVEWVADQPGPVAVFFDLIDPDEVDGTGPIRNWMSFMVAADDWTPEPGLAAPRRFTVRRADGEVLDRPLQRRWSAESVDPASAPADQYLRDGQVVDVFDDVTLDRDGRPVHGDLPFPDPLRFDPDLAAGIRLRDDPRPGANL